jgi:tetratricopeptide (TPR) repeat protein
MEPLSSEDILKKVESSESVINKLVIAWREKQWVKLLLIFAFVSLSFLNPTVVSKFVQFFFSNPEFKLPEWYFYVWLVATIASFIAAFVIALRTTPTKFPDAPSEKSIIKGLRPYTAEDSELFAKLQRGRMLQDCLTACDDRDFRFGILNGESGTGKTSFLQAGLCPSLAKKNFRPVYVKLTEVAPLDSIREAFIANHEIKTEDAENKSLLELLQQATKENTKRLIVVIDQFEQFFVSHKSKTERKHFIQEMSAWYNRRDSLPVKILFSIRGDFFYRLSEFQDAMKYTLTVQDNFPLDKFSPEEAANVFRVIAETEKIECDENFIKEITAKELSDSDGLVSPVDVQVLSWIIAGKNTKDEKAFNRQAFSKGGGVEGLLESFLKKTLESEPNIQNSAIKVLLVLTADLEKNARARALSLNEIQTKLKETISANNVAKSVEWLSSSGVRLITAINDKKKKQVFYELTHERIIPALRKLANKELSEIDNASKLLDQRFNEWTDNNHSRRYLLTFKEWLLVRRNKSLISSDSSKELKERFIAQSKHRFVKFAAGFTIISLLGGISFGIYQWNENRLETKMKRAQNRLIELLEKNNDTLPIQNSALLLSFGENKNFDKSDEILLRHIGKLSPSSQIGILTALAEGYTRLENKDQVLNGLDKVLGLVEKLGSTSPDRVLKSLARGYITLGDKDRLNGLNRVLTLAEKLTSDSQARIVRSLIESYSDLENREQALNGLKSVRPLMEKLDFDSQASIFSSLAKSYIKFENKEEASNSLTNALALTDKRENRFQIGHLIDLAESYIKLKNKEQAQNILNMAQALIEKRDLDSQLQGLLSLAGGYVKLENEEQALNILNRAFALTKKQSSLTSTSPNEQILFFSPLAKGYAQITNKKLVANKLNEILAFIGNRSLLVRDSFLGALAGGYSDLEDKEQALDGLNMVLALAEESDFESQNNTITVRALLEGYIKLDNKEEAVNGLNKTLFLLTKLSSFYQGQILSNLAENCTEFENKKQMLNGLNIILNLTGKGDPIYQVRILSYLAEGYIKLENKEEALNGLNKLLMFIQRNDFGSRAPLLIDLAKGYVKFEDTERALNVLAKAQETAQRAGGNEKNPALLDIAVLYAKLKEWDKALMVVQPIIDESYQIMAYSRVLTIWKSPKTFELVEKMFEVDYQERGISVIY